MEELSSHQYLLTIVFHVLAEHCARYYGKLRENGRFVSVLSLEINEKDPPETLIQSHPISCRDIKIYRIL